MNRAAEIVAKTGKPHIEPVGNDSWFVFAKPVLSGPYARVRLATLKPMPRDVAFLLARLIHPEDATTITR